MIFIDIRHITDAGNVVVFLEHTKNLYAYRRLTNWLRTSYRKM